MPHLDQSKLFTSTTTSPHIACCRARSLSATLAGVSAGTGEVRRVLAAATFRPRLPGAYCPVMTVIRRTASCKLPHE